MTDLYLCSEPDFSVIIPVSNEGYELVSNVQGLWEEIHSECKPSQVEIILVTDLFVPQTINAMKILASRGLARGFVMTRSLGKGGSIKNIVNMIRGRVSIIMDADTPIDFSFILKYSLRVLRGETDIMLAQRIARSHGWSRKFLSISYNCLCRILFRTGLRDHQAGLKVINTKCLKHLLCYVRTDDYGYDTELIVWARKLGYKVDTFYVKWREKRSSPSNILAWRTILTMLLDLLLLRFSISVSPRIGLRKVKVGVINDVGGNRQLNEFMTVINVRNRMFKQLIAIGRNLYLTISRRRQQL